MRRLAVSLLVIGVTACDGTPPPEDGGSDAGGDECPSLTEPLASPGDPIDGDTWETFASPFFASYCTRCHSSSLTGDDRFGAPDGFDWDDEASVRANLTAIRAAVGTTSFMPPSDPKPTCAERERLVRWIDAGAP